MEHSEEVDLMLDEALGRVQREERQSAVQQTKASVNGAATVHSEAVTKSDEQGAARRAVASATASLHDDKNPRAGPSRSGASRSRSTSHNIDRKKRIKSSSGGRKKSRSGSRDRRHDSSRAHSRSRKCHSNRQRSRSRSSDQKRSSPRTHSDSRKSQSSRHKSRSSDRDGRSRSRHSRSRDRRRSSSRDRRRRSAPRERTRRSRSRSRPRVLDHRNFSAMARWRRSPPRNSRLPGPERRDVMPFKPRGSPPPNAKLDMTAEERDQRTIFILQIARETRPRDLEEFFSSVGHVRDVRIITDSRTRRSKGICYVEFWEIESVNLALALNGQKLLGAPLMIQASLAERNRAANVSVTTNLGFGPVTTTGCTKLYIGQLHPSITDEMLRGIFTPFGSLDDLEVAKDIQGASQGYAHVTFRHADEAKKAIEQMNGFELAGRSIKVAIAEVEKDLPQRVLDTDDADRRGIDLGLNGRLHLMAKLAEGTGLEVPKNPLTALTPRQEVQGTAGETAIHWCATECFVLSNMFDPTKESGDKWADEVREDVIEECAKLGGVLHVYVDKDSVTGNVYVKSPSVEVACRCVNALHGRWFSGKVITANYVPLTSYTQLFPKSQHCKQPIYSSSQITPGSM